MRGIGNDIIEIERILRAIHRHGQRFLDHIFTPLEQTYCKNHPRPEQHFSGRFAAKEAIVKALGTGFTAGISWLDIEILNNAQGKPEVIFSQRLNERFNFPVLLISISHCKEFATAVALYP